MSLLMRSRPSLHFPSLILDQRSSAMKVEGQPIPRKISKSAGLSYDRLLGRQQATYHHNKGAESKGGPNLCLRVFQ